MSSVCARCGNDKEWGIDGLHCHCSYIWTVDERGKLTKGPQRIREFVIYKASYQGLEKFFFSVEDAYDFIGKLATGSSEQSVTPVIVYGAYPLKQATEKPQPALSLE